MENKSDEEINDHFNKLKEIIEDRLCSKFYDYIETHKLTVCSINNSNGENLLHVAIQSPNPLFPSHVISIVVLLLNYRLKTNPHKKQ